MVGIFLVGCATFPGEVQFRLPEKFKGLVEVSQNPSAPNPFTPKDGRVAVKVPADGVIATPNLEMFQSGVHEEFVTSSGTPLNYEYEDSPAGVVRVYSLGYSISQGKPPRIGYFVGTPEEFKRVNR
ncbi:MAG TPA: hypothetical protein VG944_13520, partial [Fimbriimonas sp.]|nr:hypothetical protein [Fimbriimonas sp.]